MPEYFKALIAGLVFLIAAGTATAELFQYKDQNGITRLTDNIYSVPVKYRSQLDTYSEIESLSGKMEIQPLEKKSTSPRTKEKIFIPKLDKIHHVDDEPDIVPPAGPQKIKAEVASKISPEQTKDLPDTPKAEHKASKAEKAEKESLSTAAKSKLAKKTDTIPAVRSTITKIAVPEELDSEQGVNPKGTGHHVSQSVIIDKGLRSPEPPIPAGAAENHPPLAISKPEIPARVTEKSETVIQKATNAERPEHAGAAPEKTATANARKPSPSTSLDVKKAQGRSIKAEMQEKALTTETDFHPPENSPKTIEKTEIRETPSGIKTSGNRTTTEQALPGDQQGTPVSGTAGLSAAPAVQQTADRIDPESFVEKNEDMQLAYLQTTRKTLAAKKDALNQRYTGLMQEKAKLEKSVDEDDEKSVQEYNKNVKILNIKIKQYKIEKKTLQAEIETYNSLIRQSSAN